MSLLRVFVAIELPKHIRDAIEKQTSRLRLALGDDSIRWTPIQNIHLTLKFIGDVAASHTDFLKQLLVREANSHAQFDLQIGGLGSYPASRAPRVIWLGVYAPAELTSLQKSVEAGVFRLGYEQEKRAFSPHLTLGRVRQNAISSKSPKIRATLDAMQLGNIGLAKVDSIHLFKSDLYPSGSIYTKLFSAPLKSGKQRGET